MPWPHAPMHQLGSAGMYFVTASTLHQAHHFKGKERLAVLHRGVLKVAANFGWRLEAWAVFSNHYHFVAQSPELEDNAKSLADAKAIFEAEQTRKENVIIKEQKAEIQRQNHQLQDTIDELTRAKIGRKAKALTLAVAIVLFIFQDAILRTALRLLASDNYFLLLGVKMAIIFSLAPINRGIENHLLKKMMQKQRLRAAAVAEMTLAVS